MKYSAFVLKNIGKFQNFPKSVYPKSTTGISQLWSQINSQNILKNSEIDESKFRSLIFGGQKRLINESLQNMELRQISIVCKYPKTTPYFLYWNYKEFKTSPPAYLYPPTKTGIKQFLLDLMSKLSQQNTPENQIFLEKEIQNQNFTKVNKFLEPYGVLIGALKVS